ncbi:MAG TPA: hypothetical protein VM434_18510 [Beijerinckiaceae bacterium]|nr:hypothetical protein [Beijerinckiaceae bacterium]
MLDPTQFVTTPAPGRACGTCTLCCKVYDVPSLDKKMGVWCRHCLPGRGCGIHETRPDHCRAFHCLWMTETWLGPEWKPEKSKMVLTLDPATRFLMVQVDPGSAAAWKREPYYGQLKQWAAAGLAERRHVVVFLNTSATVVLPDRDVPVGTIGPGDRITVRERLTAQGPRLEVEKVAAAA